MTRFDTHQFVSRLRQQLSILPGTTMAGAVIAERTPEETAYQGNPLFNYGVDQSIRERFSGKSFDHYFQKLDGRMYLQVLEKDILDGDYHLPR